MLRRQSPSSASLTGGDLSVDILHTEDSVQIGDGTNLLGSFPLVGGLRSLPVANSTFATDSTLTGGTQRSKLTDGVDNVEIDDVGGEKALKVSVIASVGGGGGGTAATDSAAFTATATQFTPIGGYRDDTASDALAEGEMGAVRMNSARAIHVYDPTLEALLTTQAGYLDGLEGYMDGVETLIGSTNTLITTQNGYLDGLEGFTDGLEGLIGTTNTNTGNAATSLAIIDDWDATHGSAHPTDGVMAMGSNGTNAYRLRVTDSNGRLSVDVNSMPTVAVTGTFWQATQPVSGTFWQATQPVSLASLPALAAGTNNIGDVDVLTLPALPAGSNNIGDVDVLTMPDVTVIGKAAHDAGVSGNPVRIAGRAMLANGTAVAEDDVADLATDNQGRAIVTPHVPRDLVTHGTATLTSTTETSVIAAGGAGVFHDLTKIVLTNSSSTATRVQIRDASAGTIRMEVALAANGGAVIDFGAVPMCMTTANNAWYATLSGAVTSVYVYYQAIKRIA